jgi:hypothetical protein
MLHSEHQRPPSRKPRRVLSYANVVATLALVLAIGGGSAYAAKRYLITSTKQIKPSVVTALRRPAVKLGTTGATGSSGGSGVTGTTTGTGLVRWRTTAATAGASPTSPTIVTLATDGPFTVTGECFSDGSGNTEAGTYIQTSQDGAAVESGDNGETVPIDVSDGAVEVDDTYASGVTATNSEDFEGADGGSWAAESVDGSVSLQGLGAQGVWMQGPSGPACSFSGFLVGE